MEWANNPDIIAKLSLRVNGGKQTLAELVYAFVEYDAKITGYTETELAKRKGKMTKKTTKKRQEKEDIFYVK